MLPDSQSRRSVQRTLLQVGRRSYDETMTAGAVNEETIYTIGHSTHEIGTFVALLMKHGIDAIADVRSAPYSRRQPQFNCKALANVLRSHGIAYVFLGRELGARSDDPACYEKGRVKHRLLARTPLFLSGIERIRDGSHRMNIALMCAEREPLDCHRTILVARQLVETGSGCFAHFGEWRCGTPQRGDGALGGAFELT